MDAGGYYAASPSGERLIGWQFNGAPDELAAFHPVARFRARFLRPDVVREVLAAGGTEAALTKLGAAAAAVAVPVAPPKVAILAPAERSTTTDAATVTVTAEAVGTAENPVRSLQLVVDGRPFDGARGFRSVDKPAAGSKREEWAVPLVPGKTRTITVVADNGKTKAVSESVEVTGVKPAPKPVPAPAPAPPPPDQEPRTLHVLAVGVDDYPGDMKLTGAVADATGLGRSLEKYSLPLFTRGVSKTLKTDAQATRAEFLKALDELATRVKSEDVTVIFYAGHGHTRAKDDAFYLLTHGSDENRLAEAVSGDELKEKLRAIDGKIIVMLDACRSAAIRDKGLGSRNSKYALERSLKDEEYGVIVMSAVSTGQDAIEQNGHGLFTKALMAGLAGAAGPDERGEIDLIGLEAYVVRSVKRESKRQQIPALYHPLAIIPFSIAKPPVTPAPAPAPGK